MQQQVSANEMINNENQRASFIITNKDLSMPLAKAQSRTLHLNN